MKQLWLTPVVLGPTLLGSKRRCSLSQATRGVIRVEHTIKILESLPNAQLCILLGTGHDTFRTSTGPLDGMIMSVLDAS